MSDVKFTPGPYFVSGKQTIYVEARIGDGWIQEVAACGPTDADGGYGDQQRANANLFAAAPDGYVLAELVMDICGNPKGISEASQNELYETALQYIKKARGES